MDQQIDRVHRPALTGCRAHHARLVDDAADDLGCSAAVALDQGVGVGRAGRIAGSSCVPAASLFGPDKTLKPIAELRAAFEGVGAAQDKDRRILVYCGGGIAATLDAFVLTAMLGHRNVAVYDNSMQEWSNDPSLPMETG